MKIKDLSAPVTVAKADWLGGTNWIGFTPEKDTLESRNKCESSINKLISGGYLVEYITKKFGNPNKKFAKDPQYMKDRELHKSKAGRLVAVHKLNTRYEKLDNILIGSDFKKLQEIWSQDGTQYRWSVAFRIIESYEIIGKPLAEDILGTDLYRDLFNYPSKSLRLVNNEVRRLIDELDIKPQTFSQDIWQMIDDDIKSKVNSAERTIKIANRLKNMIDSDLIVLEQEGHGEEHLSIIRKRSYLVLAEFIRRRENESSFKCDHCGFDPSDLAEELVVSKRRFFDVHHKEPLAEGGRLTSANDFALLCPTCHRMEHIKLRAITKASNSIL